LEGGAEDGAAAVEDPPKEDAKSAKSDKPKSNKSGSNKSEKKPVVEEEKKNEDDDPYAEPIMEPCCCCDCVCSNEFTKESSCCGCFPVKCGAVAIGIITVFVTTILFVWYFFLFLNEYIHWWFVLVCLFLLCPILVGSSFIISWFTNDSRTTRTMLYTSQILALVSVLLLCIWNLIYFIFIYKKDRFYAGMGDIPTNVYTSQSKKNFIFTMLGETVFMLILFGYFLCVTAAYSADMHGPEEEEEKKDEEDKKSEKSAKSGKSNKSAKSAKSAKEPAAGEDAGEAAAAE